jgi:S-methylmethionine-dependent homocysteine/selenocysteine methylase
LIEELSPYVDLWLCETQSLLAEAISVRSLIARLDDKKKPVWISFTLEDAKFTEVPLLRSGEPVVDAVKVLFDLDVDAILFNCCQPEVIGDAIQVTRDVLASLNGLDIKIGAYANAFPPQPKNATANEDLDEIRSDLTPSSYLRWAELWRQKGATLFGGCCGIGPDHITLLKNKLSF